MADEKQKYTPARNIMPRKYWYSKSTPNLMTGDANKTIVLNGHGRSHSYSVFAGRFEMVSEADIEATMDKHSEATVDNAAFVRQSPRSQRCGRFLVEDEEEDARVGEFVATVTLAPAHTCHRPHSFISGRFEVEDVMSDEDDDVPFGCSRCAGALFLSTNANSFKPIIPYESMKGQKCGTSAPPSVSSLSVSTSESPTKSKHRHRRSVTETQVGRFNVVDIVL